MNASSSLALPHLASAAVVGADAVSFLDGQLSASVARLEIGRGGFATVCDIKGRVIALLYVIRTDTGAQLVADRALLPEVLDHLKKFVLRSAVEWRIDADDAVLGAEPAADASPVYAVGPASESAPDAVARWRRYELEHGVSWLGPETSRQFLPQMLGYEKLDAVQYDKGCFPGQEVIARVHWRGQVKRKPLTVHFEAAATPAPMTDLDIVQADGQASGVWVDSATDGGAGVALLVVRNLADAPVQAIEWPGGRLDVQRSATM